MVIKVKQFLMDEIKDSKADFAFDLRKVKKLDSAAMTFFKNIEELLARDRRKVAFFGGPQEIQDELQRMHSFTVYPSIVDFERDFHEMNPLLYKTFLRLSNGRGPFRTLQMICPLCGHDNVAGFMIDENYYRPTWTDSEIVPVYEPIDPDPNAIDFSAYQVAVCPKCFYASTRLDWFTIVFNEGTYESRLTQENRGKLANTAALRRNLAMQFDGTMDASFWRLPRETGASYASWRLNEFNLKHMGESRTTDGCEIVTSNFMMCKFASSERDIDEHMHTALAWLGGIMQNKENYSTLRVVKSYTYLVSILVAQDKVSEAKKLYKEAVEHFSDLEEGQFWLARARELISD
jgi:hypothetical protein